MGAFKCDRCGNFCEGGGEMRLTEEQEQEVIYRTGYTQALKDVGEYIVRYIIGGYRSGKKSYFSAGIPALDLEALRRGEMPKEIK